MEGFFGYEVPVWVVLLVNGGYVIFSSAVSAMPMPEVGDSKLYRFWFQFLNTLAANFSRAKTDYDKKRR